MCTYDYTPYRGCEDSQQHFYLQWMKCNKALENGKKYCPLEESVEVEELKKLSGNILFCPQHNPIAVQQHEFLFLTRDDLDDLSNASRQPVEMRSRSRTTRRPVTMYKSEISTDSFFGEQTRRTGRRKIARNLSPSPTPDSEPEEPIPRPRTASGVKRLDDRKMVEDRRSVARTRSHRRVSSVEFGSLPTVKVTRPKTIYDDTNDAREATEEVTVPEQDETRMAVLKPFGPLSPGMRARLGLPASPDMHRRSTVASRSRSESPFQLPEYHVPSDGPATDPEFVHPLFSQDSSPDQKLEPFAPKPAVRRARTSRSSRTSEERAMRRIEEDKRAEEELTRLMPSPKRTVTMTFPDQEHQTTQPIGLGLQSTDRKRVTRTKSEAALPRSHKVELEASPMPRRTKYVREEPPTAPPPPPPAAPNSTNTTPEQPGSNNQTFSYVHTSIRGSRTGPEEDDGQDASSVLAHKREARKSRRYEDQVAEAKKWAAARDQHFSSSVPNLHGYDKNYHHSPPEPVWLGPRQSNDSGYLSGQQHQQQQKRNTLHKAQPSTTTTSSTVPSEHSTIDVDFKHAHQYQQLQQRLPVAMKQDVVHVTAIPHGQHDGIAASDGEKHQGKPSLLKRMGLKRKISNLWERNGHGAAATVAG